METLNLMCRSFDKKGMCGGGGGLMHDIKAPLQDFALKLQGGFMHEGGPTCICGICESFLHELGEHGIFW